MYIKTRYRPNGSAEAFTLTLSSYKPTNTIAVFITPHRARFSELFITKEFASEQLAKSFIRRTMATLPDSYK